MKYTLDCKTHFVNQTKTVLDCTGNFNEPYFTIQLFLGVVFSITLIYSLYRLKEYVNDLFNE